MILEQKAHHEQMTVFLIALFFLLPIQGHSLWSLKHRAAGGERSQQVGSLLELTQINTPHTHTHTHSTRQFLAYISLDCGKKLKLYSDKNSSCKTPRAKVQSHTASQTAVQTTEPMHHPPKQTIYKYSNTIILSVSMPVFLREKNLWAVNSLWLCLRSNHPLCASVYIVDIKDSL